MYGVTPAGRLSTVIGSGSASINVQEHLILEQGEVAINGGAIFGFRNGASLAGTDTMLLNGDPDSTSLLATNIPSGVVVRTGATGGGRIFNGENNGIISAETTGQTLRLTGSFNNFGLIRSSNGSTVEIDIPNWSNAGHIQVGPAFRIGGGVVFEGTTFENLESGTITGPGTLRTLSTPLVNSCTLSPGDGVGAMIVAGALELTSASRVVVEVLSPQQADLLTVNGAAKLGGELQVQLLDYRQLDLGDTFTILNSSTNLEGQFAHEDNLVRSGYAMLQINYLPRSVSLTVVRIPEPPTSLAALLALCVAAIVIRKRSMLPQDGG